MLAFLLLGARLQDDDADMPICCLYLHMHLKTISREDFMYFKLILNGFIASVVIFLFMASVANAQGSAPLVAARDEMKTTNPVVGKWTYRSFLSNPDLNAEPNTLLFGRGTLTLSIPAPDRLTGSLGGDDWELALSGGVTYGNPATIRFQGKGVIGGEEWIYDYLGYLVPVWPNGENQRPAIIGTIVRTKSHANGSGGVSPAGVVAQWIAVKMDGSDPANLPAGRPALSVVPNSAIPGSGLNFGGTGLIRQNPPSIYPPFGELYSHGVEVPTGFRTLYIAGQAGVSLTGAVPENVDAQLDLAWSNLKQVLAASRMTVDDLVQVTAYLADEKYAQAYAKSVIRNLGKERPVMSAPIVRRLWSPDWHVEIEAIAAARQDATSASLQILKNAGDAPSRIPGPPIDMSPEAVRRGNLQLRELYRAQDALERSQEPRRRERQIENLRKSNPATPTSQPAAAAARLSGAAVAGPPSLNPVTVTSNAGRLDLTLDLDYHTFTIGNDQVRLRTYGVGDKNGVSAQYPVGPVLRCKAGDVLYITLNNRLPLNLSGDSHGPNGHHQWNTTNLHFHGLHVAPQGPADRPYGRSSAESDNVLLEIPPSQPFEPSISSQYYAVAIPADHPAGTFWYHAHKHGAVASQVASGLLGALIIERDPQDVRCNLDSIPEIASMTQEVMVLQQIPYMSNVFNDVGGIEPTSPVIINDMFGPSKWRTMRRYTLVNGLRIPTITVAPGEIRRLRLIHGGQREEMVLRLERSSDTLDSKPLPSLYEIAVDGLVSGRLHNKDEGLSIFPGYRSDVLLQVPNDGDGEFYLFDENVPDGLTGADQSTEPVRRIARIVVSGASRQMDLPSTTELLRRRLPDLVQPGTPPQFAFYGIDQFTLSNQKIGYTVSQLDLRSPSSAVVPNTNSYFYSEGPTRKLKLGDTEQWIVGSRNGPAEEGGSRPLNVTHPFHIHINPFLITRVTDPSGADVTAQEFGGTVWRDTLAMRQGFTYEFLTKYETFTGSFVDHCHILDHEDHGMMELVKIESPTVAQLNNTSNVLTSALSKTNDNGAVLLFVKGSLCKHCMAQLSEMSAKLEGNKANVTIISASTLEDLSNFPSTPFSVVADPELQLFRRFGVFDGEARHGAVAFDAAGNEVFRVVSDEPLMDAAVLKNALKRTARETGKSAK